MVAGKREFGSTRVGTECGVFSMGVRSFLLITSLMLGLLGLSACESFGPVGRAEPQALTALPASVAAAALAAGYVEAEGHLGWTNVAQGVTDGGQATITVPIVVPPGRSGMQPGLSLSYNSGRGDGPMGVGWQLTGLGAITRCGLDVGRDGTRNDRVFTDSDGEKLPITLCLDGQRLIENDCSMAGACDPSDPFSLADYRLESSGAVVVFRDGEFGKLDTTFTVRSRDGGVQRYGGRGAVIRAELFENDPSDNSASPRSNSEPQWGSSSAVTYAWLLYQTEDIAGNQIDIEYTERRQEHAVEVLPDMIHYTGHTTTGRGDRSVKFDYATRQDPQFAFRSGFPLGSFRRLTAVSTFAPDVSGPVRTYELTYVGSESTGRQLLRHVQECSLGDRCREPIVFEYSEHKFAIEEQVDLPSIPTDTWAIVDTDGDGTHELFSAGAMFRPLGLSPTCTSSAGCDRGTCISGFCSSVRGALHTFDEVHGWENEPIILPSGGNFPVAGLDQDFDGRDEIIVGSNVYRVWVSSGVTQLIHVRALGGTCAAPRQLGVYTGNIVATTSGLDTHVSCRAPGTYLADFDGDGVHEFETSTVLPQEPEPEKIRWPEPDHGYFAMTQLRVDMNADGLTDVLGMVNPLEPLMWINTGNGFLDPVAIPVDIGACEGPNEACEALYRTATAWSGDLSAYNEARFEHQTQDMRIADLNGDGRPDIFMLLAAFESNGLGCTEAEYYCHNGREGLPWVLLNHADHFEPMYVGPVFPYAPDALPTYQMRIEPDWGRGGDYPRHAFTHVLMDADGDGHLDLVLANPDRGYGHLLRTTPGTADRIVRVHAASSNLGTFEYGPLASVHTPAEDCEGDTRCGRYGTVVVSHATGVGETFDHRYAGQSFDQARQEGLGFEAHRVTNRATLEFTEQHFDPAFMGSSGRHDHVGQSRFMLRVRGNAEDGHELVFRLTEYDETILAAHQPEPTFVSHIRSVEDRTYEALGWEGCAFPCSEARFNEQFKRSGAELLFASDKQIWHDEHGSVRRVEESTPYLGRLTGTTFELQNIARDPKRRFVLGLPTKVIHSSHATIDGSTIRDAFEDQFVYDGYGMLVYTLTRSEDGRRNRQMNYVLRNPFGQPYWQGVYAFDDPGWHVTQTRYDRYGFVRQIRNPLGHTADIVIHPASGAAVLTRDSNGHIATTVVDGFHRTISAATPTSTSSLKFLPESGGVLVIAAGTGRPETRQIVDVYGRVQHQQTDITADASTTRAERWFNWEGRELVSSTETDPEGRSLRVADYVTTRVHRDSRDRVKSVSRIEHGNLHTVQRVSYSGREVYWTDNEDQGANGIGAGAHHTLTRDFAGQVIRSTVNSSEGTQSLNYRYGTFGRLIETQEGTARWTREFDARGQLLRLTDPDAGARRFAYNDLGQVIEEQYDSGEAFRTVQYDRLGRPTLVQERDQPGESLRDTLFEWDPVGNLGALASTYREQDDVSREYIYDSLGRVIESHLKAGGRSFEFGFDYNTDGQLARIDYPSSPAFLGRPDARLSVENIYNNGALSRVQDADTGDLFWQADHYAASGAILDEHFGNGVSTSRHLDPVVGRLSQITTHSAFADLSDVSLDWTHDARLAARTEMIPGGSAASSATPITEEFGYDGLGRLTGWDTNGRNTGKFEYDRRGNLQSLLYQAYDPSGSPTENWGNSLSFSGHQVADVNGVTAHHDELGRWTALGNDAASDVGGDGWGMSFNHFDLPTEVVRNGQKTVYGYDASGSRVWSDNGTRQQLSFGGLFDWSREDGEQTFLFRVAGGTGIAAEIEDTQNDATTTFVHHDHLGNRTLETDSIGDVVERHRYTPFGERLDDTGRPIQASGAPSLQSGFGGHRHEDTGFVDMRGRHYDPTIGRFLSVDPVNIHPFNPQSYNGYAYVLNDPMTLTDPTGFWPQDDPGGGSGGSWGDGNGGGGYGGGGPEARNHVEMLFDAVGIGSSGGGDGGGTGHAAWAEQLGYRNAEGVIKGRWDIPIPERRRARINDVQSSRAPTAPTPTEGMALGMPKNIHIDGDWDLQLVNWLSNSGVENFFAGMGDAITFGATESIRGMAGLDQRVDSSSGAYAVGAITGILASWKIVGVAIAGAAAGLGRLYRGARAGAQAVGAATAQIAAQTPLYTYVYRGSSAAQDTEAFVTSGHILSQAGWRAFNATRTSIASALSAGYEASQAQHAALVADFGSEQALVRAQAILGTDFAKFFGARSLFSVTTDVSRATHFAHFAAPGKVYGAFVRTGSLIRQTLPTSTEAELFIRHGSDAFRVLVGL